MIHHWKMHFVYLLVIVPYIGSIYGFGQNIDQTASFPIENTSASNHGMSGSGVLISSSTLNPQSQTTEKTISGIQIQSSTAENRIDSTSLTVTPQTISPTQYSTNKTESTNTINSISTALSNPMQNYSNNPSESKNSNSDLLSENTEAPPTPGQIERGAPHFTTRNPDLPTKQHSVPYKPNTFFPPKNKTAPVSRPKSTSTLPTKPPKTKPPKHSMITKKYTNIPRTTIPLIHTSRKHCSIYTGTLLELIFENNSQSLCRNQIEEILSGIREYANEVNDIGPYSVLVLNDCNICQAHNETQVTLKFCIQTEESCNLDATKRIWNEMDDPKEIKDLESYIPVKIVSLTLTVTEQESMNVLSLSLGLLSVAFLILISAIFIFRGKSKKKQLKDRFYFDGSTIQDCLDSETNGNVSFSLNKVKDRELKHMSLLVPAINLGLDIEEDQKPENEFPSHLLSVSALKMYYTYKEAIDEEFKSLPNFRLKNLPVGMGNKNRIPHILPALDTRVVLSSIKDSNGYINANKIKGYQSSTFAYIATQAPLSNTCVDFWHMVWEQQSRVIIMLCTSDEVGKNVPQYWPKINGMEGALLFGEILVSLETVTITEHHTVSHLVVKDIQRNLCRPVSHYWFRWPVAGVPRSPSDITGLLLHIRESVTENQGPMVVHCSDGIGRTGTLLAIDIGMHELEDTTHVDVPHTTCMVRKDRGAAVDNALQYNYIYQALYDYSQRLSRANQQVGW
ncbi:uncharacterized protein [Antedon mediterranea]|uniref:uncharacterized protein n=1 Tax=Antedon mediterranea TaxID=105859 RepID=UPI003AF84CA4